MASGDKVTSSGVCQDVLIDIHGKEIKEDFHVIPLNSYDLVLGAKWLEESRSNLVRLDQHDSLLQGGLRGSEDLWNYHRTLISFLGKRLKKDV